MTVTTPLNISQERLLHVIRGPHISEKGSMVADKHKQFVFKVAKNTNKNEIKRAIELLFEVKVDSVTVCNVKGKARRFKQMLGQRQGWKKAYVSLKEGYDIDFTGNK